MALNGVSAKPNVLQAPLELEDGAGMFFKLPSLSTTERDAITKLNAGVCIFNSTTSRVEIYNGSTWQPPTMLIGIYGVSTYGQCIYA